MFNFVASSREAAINMESELIVVFESHILEKIKENKKWFLSQKENNEKIITHLNSYFEIPEFKRISMNKKLKKIKNG